MVINSSIQSQNKKITTYLTNLIKNQYHDIVMCSNVTITTPIMYSVSIKSSSPGIIQDRLFCYRDKNMTSCSSFMYTCAICSVNKKHRLMATYEVPTKHGILMYKCCTECAMRGVR